MKKLLSVLVCLFFMSPFVIFSAIGPEVSVSNGQELKWEGGSHDYFVMFKSLLENRDTVGEGTNPQADTCADESVGTTFNLNMTHVPVDARIDKAFLVWTGAVPSTGLQNQTDNEVTLTFAGSGGDIDLSKSISASRSATVSDFQDFEFESYRDPENPERAYFSYRVDVTEFFDEIHQKGRELMYGYDGLSLLGDYTVSDLTCTDESNYLNASVLVSGWALVLVYTSEEILPKKIYMYNGLTGYWHQESELSVAGFEFPNDPSLRISLMVAEGDPGNAVVENPNTGSLAYAESLQIQGDGFEWLQMFNECNYLTQNDSVGQILYYTEVYNSISSVYGYSDEIPTCIGGTPPAIDTQNIEYAMDVDTFVIDTSATGMEKFREQFKAGGDHISLKIGANQDWILSNFMVLSVDTKAAAFDIPPNEETPDGREKSYCSCASDQDKICLDRPFYSLIKVQNWGEGDAANVTVQETIPEETEYVQGTTMFATEFDSPWHGTNWKLIPDNPNGEFPLLTPVKLADSMIHCDRENMTCEDTILVRFMLQPKEDLPKHTVMFNSATISDVSSAEYVTNSSVDLRLAAGSCPATGECGEPSIDECGGEYIPDNNVDDNDNKNDDDIGDDIGGGVDNSDGQDNNDFHKEPGCSVLLI